MAKVTVVGDAVVVTSSMKLEDIRAIQKYRPSALTLMGGENNKEPVFAVGTTRGNGNINAHGASFSGEARDDSGLATITLAVAGVDSDIKEWVADHIGAALISLNKLEAALPGALQGIRTERAQIMENIALA
jgi:hypothetical protein